MEEKINKEELARQFTQEIEKMAELENLEEMLKNNIIEWDLDGIRYRVRKPDYKERQEIRTQKALKLKELLKDDAYMYEKELIAAYAKKGIDVIGLTNRGLEIQREINETKLKLAEFGDHSEEEMPIIGEIKKQIFELMIAQKTVLLEKEELLSLSVESELTILVNSYTCYLVLEQKTEDWKRAFANFDSFMNSENEKLLTMAGHYLAALMYHIEQGKNE